MKIWFFKDEKTNFFQCHHLILNEICPFSHKPYGKHNQPTNYLIFPYATNIMIMIMSWQNHNLCN
jgi:hypothetical protein